MVISANDIAVYSFIYLFIYKDCADTRSMHTTHVMTIQPTLLAYFVMRKNLTFQVDLHQSLHICILDVTHFVLQMNKMNR